jgi:hypothetical protein
VSLRILAAILAKEDVEWQIIVVAADATIGFIDCDVG